MKPYYNVVGAIIIKDNKVFAPRKGESKYSYTAHKYEFPGGKIEQGETPEIALRRELQEELDLEVMNVIPFMEIYYDYPDFAITLNTFLCNMKGTFTLKEHENYNWLSKEELKAEEWAPADAKILEALFAQLA